jgi:hypothetical protein
MEEEEKERKKVRVDWVYISQAIGHWRDFMNTVMKF